MTRLEANRKIVEILSTMVEMHPDQRFVQLIRNMDIITSTYMSGDVVFDPADYYTESEEILTRVKESIIVNPRR